MSGWAFDVTVSQVKRKTKTVRVRAFSHEEAVEIAKKAADSYPWEAETKGMEYDARELNE